MVALPCFVVVLLLGTCLGQADEADNEPLKCPGVCKHGNDCGRSINETDCSEGLVCCVDLFEQITTSEFPDWSFTTQGSVDPDSPEEEVKEEILETGQPAEEYEYAATNGDQGYTYVYSESDAVTVDPEEPFEMTSQEAAGGCPGQCVAPEYATACNYIINTINDDICPAGGICCFVSQKEDVDEVSYENDPKSFQRRISVEEASGDICPGTCVHPSHAMFCDRIIPEYPCPLNAKCCVKRAVERSVPQSPAIQCFGRCLPASMHGYCFPPNELMLGETSCPRGTTCCMKKPADNLMQPPSVNRMQFPSIPSSSPMDAAQVVLGHLAVDEEGTVYRVNTNGAIHPLPKLTTTDHLRARYNRLTAYPRPNGEIVIFSDAQGILYQQLFPRLPQGFAPQSPPPASRQPINQFADSSQSVDQLPPTEAQEEPDEEVKGIVLPDDGDAAPVVANTPVVHDGKNSRPNCPGTCMSYFMRFTCYRGYATYDGFFCPGRSVCCARLTDIEEHEEYLKSLSPYFKNPHVAREMTAPTCGIKGRRDTPRIVGGKDALPGEWCWQVSIINVQNQYICGGALIDNSWVLTAAHCVVGPMRENKVIFVRSGVTDLKSREENRDAQTIRVMSTFVHHNFNNMNLDNNIALLRLQKPVFFNSNTCVICLPTSGRVPDAGTKCTVTGYGFVSPDGEMALRVREAKVPIVDDTECMINVTEALTNPFILPASSLCAGGHGQQDACQGDAGGPLACEIGGFHELTGLVSWSLGCGRTDVPSIYVKVPAFMGWINQIISTSSFITSL